MDYEQKYNKLVEAVKVLQEVNTSDVGIQNWVNDNVPELVESQDEKVRKWIYNYFRSCFPTWIHPDITCGEILAWLEKQGTSYTKRCVDDAYLKGISDAKSELEKQGEQKPEIKYIYPKFRVGDLIEPAKPNGYYTPVRVKYIGEGNYSCKSDDGKSFLSFPICNENEYVLTEQKPAEWSEEDEAKLKSACALIKNTRLNGNEGVVDSTIDWLKLFKQRYTWKPL